MAEISEESKTKQAVINDSEAIPTVCPMCGAAVPVNAIECSNCGEPFSPEAFEQMEMAEAKKGRWLFWMGVILVLVGGPGVAFGSYLHDLLRINIANYDNFDSWGWANQLVAVVGIIILVIGIILLVLSLPTLKSDRKSVKDKESPKSRK